ncbi:MAG: PIN domain-containing protein [Cyanobacterium sp. T60_A2020_053]|nr:PIN domain-containing protein [Cyanobacterium sp. T60_A2020_053]
MERIIPIADTGFIVALLNKKDSRHTEVVSIYLQYSTIIVPQTVLAEVAYLVGKESGILTVVAFLKGLSDSRFKIIPLIDLDLIRVAQILEQYHDSRIDFVDAKVMAVAERYDTKIVLTIDYRDFIIFRPQHCLNFEIKP